MDRGQAVFVRFVAVLIVAAVLVVSLVSKVRSAAAFDRFRAGVGELGVVPARLTTVAALAAVVGEAATLGLVAAPPTATAGLLLAGTVFLVFAATLLRALVRGAATSCHCFGASQDRISARHVVRTALLAALAYWAAALSWAGHPSALPSDIPTAVLALAVAGVAVVALVYLDELLWLFGRSTG